MPPYIATIAPSPGLIATSPVCSVDVPGPVGMLSWTAWTAASWAGLSIVVVIRRPPRSSSAWVSLSLVASSCCTSAVM